MNGINKIDNQWIYKDNDYLIRSTNKNDVRKAVKALSNAQDEIDDEDDELELIQRATDLIKRIRQLPTDQQGQLMDDLDDLESIMSGNDPEDEEDEKTIDDLLRASDDEEDEDILKKRRQDLDDAKFKAEVESEKHKQYAVLEYKIASIKADGDSFLMELGCS